MSKPFRAFLVIKSETVSDEDDTNLSYYGSPRPESNLRDWAHETFDTPLNATLQDIARAIEADGWLLYKGIWPPTPEIEPDIYKHVMQRIAEAFLGLEVYAEQIAEACKGIGFGYSVEAKTAITEVEDNHAVITITVTPKSKED